MVICRYIRERVDTLLGLGLGLGFWVFFWFLVLGFGFGFWVRVVRSFGYCESVREKSNDGQMS